jgi:hypothetical protein
MMVCTGVQQDAKRGWMLVHRCVRCNEERRNKAALDDPVQPDSFEAILGVARDTETFGERRRTMRRNRNWENEGFS